jgi:hypothetical protein
MPIASRAQQVEKYDLLDDPMNTVLNSDEDETSPLAIKTSNMICR